MPQLHRAELAKYAGRSYAASAGSANEVIDFEYSIGYGTLSKNFTALEVNIIALVDYLYANKYTGESN